MWKDIAVSTVRGLAVTVLSVVLFSWLIGVNQYDYPSQYITVLIVAVAGHFMMALNQRAERNKADGA